MIGWVCYLDCEFRSGGFRLRFVWVGWFDAEFLVCVCVGVLCGIFCVGWLGFGWVGFGFFVDLVAVIQVSGIGGSGGLIFVL